MNKIISKLKFIYTYIISSIGFYPTLISTLFAGLALFLIYFETQGLSENLAEKIPFMVITSGDVAKTILNSIVTGVISLMVFSFTMVMVVLNTAGTNFSPRVIPGLISHKSNQKILGLYLGTLIYALIVMVNIRSDSYYEELPGLSVFMAMFFTIVCLGFFVYFIHSISQSIQIDNILESIHTVTKNSLYEMIGKDRHHKVPDAFKEGEWHELTSIQSGYVQSIDINAILEICYNNDLIIEFNQPMGHYLVKGSPFLKVNKPIGNNDELCGKLFDHVNFKQEELPDINYLYGFKHITESAIKALSPSVNDPGSAIKAIDYLTDLFSVRMELTDEQLVADKDGNIRIRFAQETFDYLYTLCITSIRLYGKHDSLVVLRLLNMLKNLLYKVERFPARKATLYKEALVLIHDTDKEITNPGDRHMLNRQLSEINEMQVLEKELPLLQVFD